MTEEVWPGHDVMTLIPASDGISRSSQGWRVQLHEAGVSSMVYGRNGGDLSDLLEVQRRDLRDQPLVQRRARLQALLARAKSDLLRFSESAALKRGIPVVPILLEGTRVPKPEQLPDDLKGLVRRQGLEVRHATFHADMDKLVRALKAVGTPVDPHITPNSPSTPQPPPLPPRAFLPSASEQVADRSVSAEMSSSASSRIRCLERWAWARRRSTACGNRVLPVRPWRRPTRSSSRPRRITA
jgi:hypothetical protein